MSARYLARGGQQFFVAGRIGQPQIVDLFDQSDAEEIGPDPIGDRPGEVGIFGRGEPVGQVNAAIGRIVERQRLAVERRGRLRPPFAGLDQFAFGAGKDGAIAVAAAAAPAFALHAGEQIGHGEVLVVGPLFQRMVVAAGAVDRHAQESGRDGFGDFGGVLMQGVEVGGAVFQGAARRGDDGLDEFVPGGVLLDLRADPLVVGFERLGTQTLAAGQQQVAPAIGPVVDELGPGQQRLDQSIALVGGRVGQKRSALRRPWATRPTCRRYARRTNSLSLAGGEGGRFRLSSLASDNSSMKLRARRLGKNLGGNGRGIGNAERGDHVQAQIPGAGHRLARAD